MRYEIHFDGDIQGEALRRLLRDRFGIDPAAVFVGDLAQRPVTVRPPVAVLTASETGGEFPMALLGDQELAERSGLAELDLARALCQGLGVRALVDDGTPHPDRWVLINRDGSLQTVIVDEDAADDGELRIAYVEPG